MCNHTLECALFHLFFRYFATLSCQCGATTSSFVQIQFMHLSAMTLPVIISSENVFLPRVLIFLLAKKIISQVKTDQQKSRQHKSPGKNNPQKHKKHTKGDHQHLQKTCPAFFFLVTCSVILIAYMLPSLL